MMKSFTTSIEYEDQDIAVEIEYNFVPAVASDGISPPEPAHFEITDLIDVNAIGFAYGSALEANMDKLLEECAAHYREDREGAAEYAAEAKRERMHND